MKLTIGISSYNQAQYLRAAIESALNQTVPCEVIVVDDGATDDSLLIAKSYEEKGVKVIAQVNKGLSSARNTAIMNMTGDYFLPLDADDVLMPNCAEKILEEIEVTHADVVAPSFQTMGLAHELVILMKEPQIEDFRLGNRVGYFSAIKKECLLECGGYSPRMVEGYEDLHLWFDLLTRGKKFVTIPQPLVIYRTKEEGMWKDAVKNHHGKLMNQIYKDFPHILPEHI